MLPIVYDDKVIAVRVHFDEENVHSILKLFQITDMFAPCSYHFRAGVGVNLRRKVRKNSVMARQAVRACHGHPGLYSRLLKTWITTPSARARDDE